MAPSLTVLKALIGEGAEIIAFDPVAEENLKAAMPEVKFSGRAFDACKDADALIIVTEWDEFKQIDFAALKKTMKKPIIFDGRNIYDVKEMQLAGFEYHSVGR